jgi:hypothetical protein
MLHKRAIDEVIMTSTSTAVLRSWPIILLALLMSGCEAIQTIFQAGVWVGVILVVVVLGVVAFVAAKLRRS